MCGKFTAQVAWREVHDFSQPLTDDGSGGSEGGDSGEIYTYRVNGMLPVIIWGAELGHRSDVARACPRMGQKRALMKNLYYSPSLE